MEYLNISNKYIIYIYKVYDKKAMSCLLIYKIIGHHGEVIGGVKMGGRAIVFRCALQFLMPYIDNFKALML